MMNLGRDTVMRQPTAARIAVKPIPPSLSLSGCWLRYAETDMKSAGQTKSWLRVIIATPESSMADEEALSEAVAHDFGRVNDTESESSLGCEYCCLDVCFPAFLGGIAFNRVDSGPVDPELPQSPEHLPGVDSDPLRSLFEFEFVSARQVGAGGLAPSFVLILNLAHNRKIQQVYAW